MLGSLVIILGLAGERTRLNLLLATDLIGSDPEMANWAKQLKSCIGWQTPKYLGRLYRAALHSPLEVFANLLKHRFYIPCFTSTSYNPDLVNFCQFLEENDDRIRGEHNVMIEIITEYPNFNTVVQKNQSDRWYSDEAVLLSCYNIYRWGGYRLAKIVSDFETDLEEDIVVPVITLYVDSHTKYNDFEKHEINSPMQPVPTEWLTSRDKAKQREISPDEFHNAFADLCESYREHYGEDALPWLNANWNKDDADWLKGEGRIISGTEFREMFKAQEEEKAEQDKEKETITKTKTKTNIATAPKLTSQQERNNEKLTEKKKWWMFF